MNCHSSDQQQINHVISAHWEIPDICYSRHETLLQTCIQFCSKHNMNISMIWAERYLKNIVQLKFRNNLEFTRVATETLKVSVSTKYGRSVGTCRVKVKVKLKLKVVPVLFL